MNFVSGLRLDYVYGDGVCGVGFTVDLDCDGGDGVFAGFICGKLVVQGDVFDIVSGH